MKLEREQKSIKNILLLQDADLELDIKDAKEIYEIISNDGRNSIVFLEVGICQVN